MSGSAAPRAGYSLPVDPLNELGDPSDAFPRPQALQYMRQLVSIVRTQFEKSITRDTAAPYFYLQSPSGKTFRVTVDDNGTITATNARVG